MRNATYWGLMLLSRVPDIESDLAGIRELAPSGFVIALNMGWGGPELLHSEFPDRWRTLYEEKNYFMTDPVFYWTLMNKGHRRWSEVGYPDPMGVNAKAKKYGLNFGAVFSKRVHGKRSFMSAARADREFTTVEMDQLDSYFNKWMEFVSERPDLSVGELQVLRCLYDGFGQAQTAEKLGIAEATVSKRARSAMKKLNASTRTEAVSKAAEMNYFSIEG